MVSKLQCHTLCCIVNTRRVEIYSFLLLSNNNCVLFVLQSPGTLNHVESMTLDGRKTKGALFGFAMAVAGDLNRDGFAGRTKTLNVHLT